MKKLILILTGLLLISSSAFCDNNGLSDLGSSIGSSFLNRFGVNVSSDDINTALDASDKLAKSARGFTNEQEYYLGRGVAAVILSKYRPLQNAALNQYVNKVGRSVAVFSDRPETFGGYHFLVLDTPEINAVSAPGGFVFITRGFLKVIPDEDSLAAVLAHEVGHVVKGHGTAAISRSNMTSALTSLGQLAAEREGGAVTSQLTSTFGSSVTDVTNSLLENGYSRSQEYEADEYAADLLKKAGYNQMALVEMLQALNNVDPSSRQGGWFTTHPTPDKREGELRDDVKLTDSSKSAAGAKAQQIRTQRFKAAVRGVV